MSIWSNSGISWSGGNGYKVYLDTNGITFKSDSYIVYEDLIPTKVIFNNRATVCYFPDGDKVVVKAAPDEQFIKEIGVAMCIIRKLFKGNRTAFLKLVENAYQQEQKEKENTE